MNLKRRTFVAGLLTAGALALTGCGNPPIGAPADPTTSSSVAAPSPTTAAPEEPTEATDPLYFDHVITNKVTPDGDRSNPGVHIVATIKNIEEGPAATYTLNYKVFDSEGQQVAAFLVDATAYNGPLAYGDTLKINEDHGMATGELPKDGHWTAKLWSVDREVAITD